MEKEIKIQILTKDDFIKVKSALPGSAEEVEQINYYFDTEDLKYAKAHCLIRIRSAKGKFILTFKKGLSLVDGYFQAYENEEELSPAVAESCFKNPAELGGHRGEDMPLEMDFSDIKLLGYSRTIRAKINMGDFIVEADEVTFPNGARDYELEVETENPEQVQTILFNILRENNVQFSKQVRTKYERFLNNLV